MNSRKMMNGKQLLWKDGFHDIDPGDTRLALAVRRAFVRGHRFRDCKKLRYFIINPCLSYSRRAYGIDGYCGSKCHVQHKYKFVRDWGKKVLGRSTDRD